jgi:hypothetical protein
MFGCSGYGGYRAGKKVGRCCSCIYIIYSVFMLVAGCDGCIDGGGVFSTRRRVRRVEFFANHRAINSIGGLLIVT